MGAFRVIPNYTYKDYLNWEGRWELIEGIPFAKSPMASPRHQRIASNLNVAIAIALNTNECDCKIYHPIDVKIKENTVVNPDLLIVCEEIEGQFLDKSFPMAIEILSPSTRTKDKVAKYNLYEEFGVKYYVIVDPDDNTVQVFALGSEGKYQQQKEYVFDIEDGCRFTVDFDKALMS